MCVEKVGMRWDTFMCVCIQVLLHPSRAHGNCLEHSRDSSKLIYQYNNYLYYYCK